MQYRRFGTLKWKVSALGFGAMRLPIIGADRGNIDEGEAIRMMRFAFDHGVNYVDTAYPYHNGTSEIVVGKALKDGYRERVRLATKMPIRMVSARNDLDRFFTEQLAKLQTDYIDFYLFHGLNRERWAKMKAVDALGWAEAKVEGGAIGHLGFSFHDDVEVFREIVDGYDGWTFCQIQYNYVDTEYQAGTRGLKYAASKGLAVVVMEPIQGGNLAVNPPDVIQAIWDEAETQRTPADWALQWVWNHPEVAVALSGMSTMDQVIENLESARRSGPATLTEKELALLSRVRERYLAIGFIGCTGCRYCVPCPEGVAIPEILALYNEHYARRGDPDAQQAITTKYGETIPPEHGAAQCVKCGECEGKCPQQLPIRNLLTRAARSFNRPG